jgi:WD40 repeat protein
MKDGIKIVYRFHIAVALWALTAGVSWAAEPDVTLKHVCTVCCLAVSPDGQLIAVGGADARGENREITLWDLPGGKKRGSLKGHRSAGVFGLTFLSSTKLLASAGHDNTLRIWDTERAKEIGIVKDLEGLVSVNYISKNNLVATNTAGSAPRLWDVSNPEKLLPLENQPSFGDACTVYAFSPDASKVATGYGEFRTKESCRPGDARIWNAENGKEICLVKKRGTYVVCLAFSPDNKALAIGYADKSICLYGAETGKKTASLGEFKGQVTSVAFTPDNKIVAAGDYEGHVKMMNIKDLSRVTSFQAHQDAVSSMTFSPDGKHLITGGFDGTAKIWAMSKLLKPIEDE